MWAMQHLLGLQNNSSQMAKKQRGESPETGWDDSITISHKTISLQHCVLLGISTDPLRRSSFLPANFARLKPRQWAPPIGLFYYSTSHKPVCFRTSNKNWERRFSEKHARAFLTVLNRYNILKQNTAILCHSVFSPTLLIMILFPWFCTWILLVGEELKSDLLTSFRNVKIQTSWFTSIVADGLTDSKCITPTVLTKLN